MYILLAFFCLFQQIMCQRIDLPIGCKHNLCEPNGKCVENSNGSYVCQCNNGYYGKHCEVQLCVSSGHCQMSVDHCNLYPRVNCLNGGKCVNVFRGFRCLCPTQFEGRLCEIEKEPNLLDGEIVVVLNGKRQSVIEHLDKILAMIGNSANVTVRVEVNGGTQEPIVHVLDNSLKLRDTGRVKRLARSSASRLAIIIQVDTGDCLRLQRSNPNLNCPDDITSVIKTLQNKIPHLNQALKVFDAQIVNIFPRDFENTHRVVIKNQLILVSVLILTITVLLSILVFLINKRTRKFKQEVTTKGMKNDVHKSSLSLISSHTAMESLK